MKKCNGPDMESRKGWFTLFPVAPSFSVKFFFPCLLRGVELGQPEKRNDAVPRFSRYERTYTASDHGRRIMVHRKSIRKEDESPLGVRRVKSLDSYRWQLQFPLSLRRARCHEAAAANGITVSVMPRLLMPMTRKASESRSAWRYIFCFRPQY